MCLLNQMRFCLFLSIVIISAFSAPTDESQATILSYEYNNDGSGNYNFRYSTSNGIYRQETGTLVNEGLTNEHIEVRGSYSFIQPDGRLETVEYTADENGFKYSKKLPTEINMRFYLLLSIIVITAYGAPTDESRATILTYEYNNDGSGKYNFRYSTSNGISRQETGTLVNEGLTNEHIEVRGSYSYIQPDGRLETVEYTADENGFKYSKELPFPINVKCVSLCFLAVFTAAVSNLSKATSIQKQIKKNVYNINESGAYSFEYVISDGTFRKEDGGLINNKGALNLVVRGEYGYIDPSGHRHYIKYIADTNGFQALSDYNDVRFNDRRIVEDVELRRIFPNDFPQDTVRKSGSMKPEHLGRYMELSDYFRDPKKPSNSHFEELSCYRENNRKVCRIDVDRYSPEENEYYLTQNSASHIDRRRFFILTLVAVASAAPQNPQDVQILRYDSDNSGLGSYSFAWELSDGSKHEEQGQLKNQGTEAEALSVQGQYAWVGPDGVTYTVTYLADENGYQPQLQQSQGGSIPSAVIESFLG
ncbi:unnamed protein product [Danaus chrysippus]|uniref:(African queen) hypothetical protein n=1 Tax=Danaus chrysippus TaxID=151541 RepID=A0A8J2VYV6_9NEOP|nr:unnamed protein product [Danaus chrysippus]